MNQTTTEDWLLKLLDHHNSIPIAGMIVGVVAIVCATLILVTLPRLWLSHRQRMAMIDRGMHPDGFIEEIEESGTEPASPGLNPPGVPPRPVS